MSEKKSVLIIDDDSRNIFALKAVLKSKGFDVQSASSANEGLEMLRSNKGVKIVLLDMMMPDLDGYETLSIIRSDEQLSNTAVFAVTAQAMMGDREKCLEAGANEYVSKPIDVDLLLDLLKHYN